jgi:hypothetical protein
MIDHNDIRPGDVDPGSCSHPAIVRIGIQKAPVPPYRLYLVTCRSCGTTLATSTLRKERSFADAPGADAPGADAPGADAPGADAPERTEGDIEVDEPAGRFSRRRKAG